MSRRVLVCGGRTYRDAETVDRTLTAVHIEEPISVLIHGKAQGADRLAEWWAKARGIPTEAYPADWRAHGRAAGPIRNRDMLREGRPDLVVGFPGGSGTRDMLDRAQRSGIPIVHIIAGIRPAPEGA